MARTKQTWDAPRKSLARFQPQRESKRRKALEAPADPVEYASHFRGQAVSRIAGAIDVKNASYDIEQNIREIRALQKINDEIFDRCTKNSAVSTNESKLARFYRNGFSTVTVCEGHEEGTVHFVTERERSEQTFDISALTTIPDELNLFRGVTYHDFSTNSGIIDCNALLQSAMILNDEVLGPFLAALKEHTQKVQVCLGGIESWLMEPKSNIQFIKETFGVDLGETKSCAGERAETGVNSSDDEVVLKVFPDSGTFDRTFEIGKENDQRKLRKFLEFLEED